MNDSGRASKGTASPVEPRLASRLLVSAADLALILDASGVVREVSLGEGLEAHPGWQKLAGKAFVDVVLLDSQPKVQQLLEESRAGQTAKSREVNLKVEGLGELPFRFTAVAIEEGRVVALGRDLRALSTLQQRMISVQQAMDREYGRLRQADTRYRVLFQVSSEGVLVADASSLKVQEANPAAATLLEEQPSELVGRPLLELFEARSRGAVQAQLAAVEAGGKPADVAVALKGRSREVSLSLALFRQSGSALVLVRFRTLGAASASSGTRSSRMLAVLESMPDGFVVAGDDRRILTANTAFCELVQQANEKQVLGQPLERWLGRPGVDLNIILANLREHGTVRNFATIVRGDFGPPQEAIVSAVQALDGRVPCLGFMIRPVTARLSVVPSPLPRSVEQLRELVGRVSLKEIVRESADLIERLCIQAALDVSGNNRASAAQLLGLSRQGLYSKLRRHGLGELEPST